MNNSMSRRRFFKSVGLGAGALVLLTVLPKANAGELLKTTISDNHGHAFVIDLVTLMTNGPMDYSIQGQSRHSHTIQVTAQALQALQQFRVVEIESTNVGGHTHIIRLEIVG